MIIANFVIPDNYDDYVLTNNFFDDSSEIHSSLKNTVDCALRDFTNKISSILQSTFFLFYFLGSGVYSIGKGKVVHGFQFIMSASGPCALTASLPSTDRQTDGRIDVESIAHQYITVSWD